MMWSSIVLQSGEDLSGVQDLMALGLVGVCLTIIPLTLALITVIGVWKLFEKAGQPGWAALVPIYNDYVRVQMTGLPMQWFYYVAICYGLIFFLAGLGGLAPLILLVLNFFMLRPFLRAFGQSDDLVNAVLYLLFPFIMYPRLGFGNASYTGVPSLHDVPSLPWIGGGSTSTPAAPPAQPTNVPPVIGGPSDSGSSDAGSFIPSMSKPEDKKDGTQQ
jgi:hypothetical protein